MLPTRAFWAVLSVVFLSSLIPRVSATLLGTQDVERKLQDVGHAFYFFNISIPVDAPEDVLDEDGGLTTEAAICVETSIAKNMDGLTREFAKEVKNFHERRRWWKVVEVTYSWRNLRAVVLTVKTVWAGLVEIFANGVLEETRKVRLKNNKVNRFLGLSDSLTTEEIVNAQPESVLHPTTRKAQTNTPKTTKKKRTAKKNRNRKRRMWHPMRVKAICRLCNLDNLDKRRRLGPQVVQRRAQVVDYLTWMNKRLHEQVLIDCANVGNHIVQTTLIEVEC